MFNLSKCKKSLVFLNVFKNTAKCLYEGLTFIGTEVDVGECSSTWDNYSLLILSIESKMFLLKCIFHWHNEYDGQS